MPRSSNFIFISLTPSLEQSTTSKSQGHPIAIMRFHASLFLVAIAATAASAQDDCPFFPGICPVTLDNTVGVSHKKQSRNRMPPEIPETLLFQCDFHDVNDIYSCQSNCATIPSCNYFSMFDDTERNQKKCFHFAQCGEDCPECTTGTAARRDPGCGNSICQEFLWERRRLHSFLLQVPRLPTSETACPRRRPFRRVRIYCVFQSTDNAVP